MINLAMTPDSSDSMLTAADAPKYGYGTCISLNEEQVKALGIDKMTIGSRVKLTAFGVLASASVEVGEDDATPNMSIQITDLEVSGASAVNADSMYPTMSGGSGA